MPLKNSCSIHARWSKSSLKHSKVSVVFFQVQNRILLHIVLLKCPHVKIGIFEIHQQWQSDFNRVYSNCWCSCSFEPEIIKIGQSSNKMYINKIPNFQEPTTILNACTKNYGNLLNSPRKLVDYTSQLQIISTSEPTCNNLTPQERLRIL